MADDCVPISVPATVTLSFTPQGLIPNSVFSVSATQKVVFSRGNLQYCAAPASGPTTHATNDGGTAQGIWRFAEHQWDLVGDNSTGNVYANGAKCSNSNASESYSGWIDLFAFGCSGWNSGAICYQPWIPNATYANAGNHLKVNLVGNYVNADWGVYNAISNGGNYPGVWRTLTRTEVEYLLNTRSNASAKKGLAIVNGINGAVLLPDEWTLPEGCSFNTARSAYNNNTYTIAQWEKMEEAGAVFLPACGARHGTGGVTYANADGYYYTTTAGGSDGGVPYYLQFTSNSITISNYYSDNARALRLVMNY